MNKFLLLILFFSNLIDLKSQNDHFLCINDSATFEAVKHYIDQNAGHFETASDFRTTILTQQKHEERGLFCNLLLYTCIFNSLIEHSLNLNYDIKKNPPRRNSAYSIDKFTLEEYERVKKEHLKADVSTIECNLFSDFLTYKELYEEYVISAYKKNKEFSLKTDVEAIIKFGFYLKPNLLKDILLSKYAHLTHKRFSQQQMEAHNQTPKPKNGN